MTMQGLDAFKKAKELIDGEKALKDGDMRDAAFFAAGINYALLLVGQDMKQRVGELDLEKIAKGGVHDGQGTR